MEPTEKDNKVIQLPLASGAGRNPKDSAATATVHDIAERQRLEHRRSWLAMMVESSADAIIGKSLDGTIISWNPAAERLYGYSAPEAIGQPISFLLAPDQASDTVALLERVRRGDRIEHFETTHLCKDGRRIAVALSLSPVTDRTGLVMGVSTIARDITERKRADERIRYLALHDALTGLPNRTLFRERVSSGIARARRNGHPLAVLFIDLDNFKEVNDSLGHHIGDRLLQVTASRLQRCLREGDGVARLGGDEFVIDLPTVSGNEEAAVIADKILEVLRAPFMLDDNTLHVSASIGISLYPHDGDDVETLMHTADSAMYLAKKQGRNNFKFSTATSRRIASVQPYLCSTSSQLIPRSNV